MSNSTAGVVGSGGAGSGSPYRRAHEYYDEEAAAANNHEDDEEDCEDPFNISNTKNAPVERLKRWRFQEEERRESSKSMPIFVETRNENSVTLDVESSMTLANLKHQIIDYKVESPQIKWNLFFSGTPLEEEEERKTLSDYNIQGSSLLRMAFDLKEGALFCVRTLDDEPDFEVEIGRFDTLNDLKAKIYDRNGYPQNDQRFIFGEMQLNNGVIIDQMDIIQTKLLSFEDLGSISSDSFQPLLYFIPRMTGGANCIYHTPMQLASSPLVNISPNGTDDCHVKESGIGNKDVLKTQKADPSTSQSRSNVMKKIQKRFCVRNFFSSKKTTDK